MARNYKTTTWSHRGNSSWPCSTFFLTSDLKSGRPPKVSLYPRWAGKRPAAVSYNTRVKTLDQNHQPHPAVSSLAILVQMFTPGFKKHNPPWVPWLPQQAGVHTHCMPAILPARALPRAMGVNPHIIQKEKWVRKARRPTRGSDQLLISLPLREPTPVVKWLTTAPFPLPLSRQGKRRTAQVWHSGFGKVLAVITGCYTWPHTRVKLQFTGKASECLHLAWCFRSPSSVLIQHPSVSRKSNRCSRPTSGYSLSVPTSWQMS